MSCLLFELFKVFETGFPRHDLLGDSPLKAHLLEKLYALRCQDRTFDSTRLHLLVELAHLSNPTS